MAEDGSGRVEVVSQCAEEADLYSSLALADDDRARIAYCDSQTQDLMFARQTADGWEVDTVRRRGEIGRWVSLLLDPDGYAHVSFYDVDQKSLHYALQSDTGWQIEPAYGAVK